ncbi:MAG: hypothetical protein ACUVWR_18340, partial [Anaerolineae bacterium]
MSSSTGYWLIKETLQPGWFASNLVTGQRVVHITNSGQTQSTDNDFLNLRPGALQVDKDWYSNDVEVMPPADPAEICIKRTGPGTPAQTLVPTASGGVPVVDKWPDANGYYCMNVTDVATWGNLWPGTYEVKETPPAGWTGAATQTVTVDSGKLAAVPGPNQTIISFDGRIYVVEFVSVLGNTWTYRVMRTDGGTVMSHFMLLLGDCTTEVIDTDPEASNIGYDGSTGQTGIKWENLTNLGSWQYFSFTLAASYPVGTIQALAKDGNNYQVGSIAGPDCGAPEPTVLRNDRILGSLEVTKYWVGGTAEGVQICVTGADYPKNCQDAPANGQTVSWDNLVPGTYTVTEEGINLTEWIVEITPGSVTVPAGGTGTSVVTNTRKGSLTVTKTVVLGDLVGQPSETFEICIQGPSYPNGNESGACQTLNYDGSPLTSLTWDNLIPGEYT